MHSLYSVSEKPDSVTHSNRSSVESTGSNPPDQSRAEVEQLAVAVLQWLYFMPDVLDTRGGVEAARDVVVSTQTAVKGDWVIAHIDSDLRL